MNISIMDISITTSYIRSRKSLERNLSSPRLPADEWIKNYFVFVTVYSKLIANFNTKRRMKQTNMITIYVNVYYYSHMKV